MTLKRQGPSTCARCDRQLGASRSSRRYCSDLCRLRAHRDARRASQKQEVQEEVGDAPARNATTRWLHCPACGLMSQPSRFMRVHPTVARVQISRSRPGHAGGWYYATDRPTDEELALLRVATENAATRMARELGEPTAKSRDELVAENDRLRAAIALAEQQLRLCQQQLQERRR